MLVRADAAGCTHELLTWLTAPGRRLAYSAGFTLPDEFTDQLELIPSGAWAPGYDADGQLREGAWVAEVTDLLDLTGWPAGTPVIIRTERPHPGAQLRVTDADGHRITAFATNTRPGGPAPAWPTWNCDTAAAPAPKTGPDAPRTPACATCRCTPSPRTRPGPPSPRWPAN